MSCFKRILNMFNFLNFVSLRVIMWSALHFDFEFWSFIFFRKFAEVRLDCWWPWFRVSLYDFQLIFVRLVLILFLRGSLIRKRRRSITNCLPCHSGTCSSTRLNQVSIDFLLLDFLIILLWLCWFRNETIETSLSKCLTLRWVAIFIFFCLRWNFLFNFMILLLFILFYFLAKCKLLITSDVIWLICLALGGFIEMTCLILWWHALIYAQWLAYHSITNCLAILVLNCWTFDQSIIRI